MHRRLCPCLGADGGMAGRRFALSRRPLPRSRCDNKTVTRNHSDA
jgi:hypothetical protein